MRYNYGEFIREVVAGRAHNGCFLNIGRRATRTAAPWQEEVYDERVVGRLPAIHGPE